MKIAIFFKKPYRYRFSQMVVAIYLQAPNAAFQYTNDDQEYTYRSYKDAGAGKAFPEVLRRTALLLFKNAVEVGNIIKAAVICHLGYRLGGIYQHPGSVAQPDFRKTVDKGVAGTLFKKAAKSGIRHVGQPGYFVQGNGFVEVKVHVFQRFLYAAAVIIELLGIVERSV